MVPERCDSRRVGAKTSEAVCQGRKSKSNVLLLFWSESTSAVSCRSFVPMIRQHEFLTLHCAAQKERKPVFFLTLHPAAQERKIGNSQFSFVRSAAEADSESK